MENKRRNFLHNIKHLKSKTSFSPRANLELRIECCPVWDPSLNFCVITQNVLLHCVYLIKYHENTLIVMNALTHYKGVAVGISEVFRYFLRKV
jgi:hypothetical protein